MDEVDKMQRIVRILLGTQDQPDHVASDGWTFI